MRDRRTIAILSSLILCGSPADARPHVVGYERFHRDAPTAAGGAVLYSELGCANCHGGSAVMIPRKGPGLDDLSKRVSHEWARTFLADPAHGRTGSNMPSMFAGLTDEEHAAAIEEVTAWLGTLVTEEKLKASRHVNAERGSALYHEIGCVACHAPTPDFKPPHAAVSADASWIPTVPHPDLRKKTDLIALNHFLADPGRYRTDGRMPHVQLDAQEAIDLAAHLLDFQASDPREAKRIEPWPRADKEMIAKGEAWVSSLNCAACHELPGKEKAGLIPLAGPPSGGRSCLSPTPSKGLPHYDLEGDQVAALKAFVGSGRPAADPDGSLTLAAMNCYACHERDGLGGPVVAANPFFIGDEGLGDSGRLPPPLTGIGWKLRRDWLERVFAGDPATRVRPYVRTRMPAYHSHAGALATWLAKLDRRSGAKPPVKAIDHLEDGRKLLGTQGGVNCITCHGWNEHASLGIRAMDISALDRRLRPEWFRSYLLDPASYRPGTLMPPLWPGGQSTVPDVLDGDTERQIGAIWAFIRSGDGVPEGFPDRSSGEFELVPVDRPIIQRTFLEDVGTKAILVGFPAGTHLAYDAAQARPALVWRGRFFDAYNTWFSRFAPLERPLGGKIAAFGTPEGEAARFLGYELDEAGNPTFLSRRNSLEIAEHFAAKDDQLIRTVRWSDGQGPPPVAHPEGLDPATSVAEAGVLTITYTWK
jgi:mono/diheme cytochrome c family protein